MQATQQRSIVDVDTRRTVFMAAKARTPSDVAKLPHEAFVRQLLKEKMGWARNEAAPEHVKLVAKQIGGMLSASTLAQSKAVMAARAAAASVEAV